MSQTVRQLSITEAEETALVEMIKYFNDLGLPDDINSEDYDTLCEKICEPAFWEYSQTIHKLAHNSPKWGGYVCIIIVCSIQILLSILRSLTQSYVHPHHMKTQFSRLQMSVGQYAQISLKSMVTLKYGTASASWVNIIMDSKETVTHKPHRGFFIGII